MIQAIINNKCVFVQEVVEEEMRLSNYQVLPIRKASVNGQSPEVHAGLTLFMKNRTDSVLREPTRNMAGVLLDTRRKRTRKGLRRKGRIKERVTFLNVD